MDNTFLLTVAEYMEQTARFRESITAKVASLQKDNEDLRRHRVSAEALKGIVAKLASAGLVDEPNKAFFDRSTRDDNAGLQLTRLAALLETNVAEKTASVPSPYRVRPGVKESAQDEATRQLNDRIRKLQTRGV